MKHLATLLALGLLMAAVAASPKVANKRRQNLLSAKEGSGFDDLDVEGSGLAYLDDDEDEAEARPKNDDIHFEDDDQIEVKLVPNRNTTDDIRFVHDDDTLYEYYNEVYEEDYDEDEEEKDHVLIKTEEPTEALEDYVLIKAKDEPQEGFKLSYVYIMLASGFFSFSLALLLYFVCRKSARERRQKAQAPLVTSMTNPRFADPKAMSSPIVKSYQRVPTSTLEFMAAPPPSNEKPLLNN